MPAEGGIADLAALVAELREIAQSLRATAGRLADVAHSSRREGDPRELARSAAAAIERAKRRGQEGGTLS